MAIGSINDSDIQEIRSRLRESQLERARQHNKSRKDQIGLGEGFMDRPHLEAGGPNLKTSFTDSGLHSNIAANRKPLPEYHGDQRNLRIGPTSTHPRVPFENI